MTRLVKKFLKDDSGAVTVDWVVLCAAMVAFALAIIAIIQTSAITGVLNMFASVDGLL